MGTAAAGAVVIGAAAGAKSLTPHLMVAGEKTSVPTAAQPRAPRAQPTVWTVPSNWDYSADVVVIGNGGAGLSSAIAAANGGASVLILEKAPKGLDYGNTGVSGGSCKIITPLTDFITVVSMMSYGTTPLDVVTKYCQEATNLPNYIKSLGGSMIPGAASNAVDAAGVPSALYANAVSPDFSVQSWSCAVPAFSYPTKGTSVTGSAGSGKDFCAFLDSVRASLNIPTMYQTPAKQLIQNPNTNEILGVVATDWTGQDINVKASKAVILACGGFENNPEMIANFTDTPHSEFLTFYGTPYNTGDGIQMAMQVGAKLWHMKKGDVHALANKPASVTIGAGQVSSLLGFGATGATSYPMIYVNRFGNRFMNEYCYSGHTDDAKAYDDFTEKFTSPDGADICDWENLPFYAIFDSKAMAAGALAGNVDYSGVHNLYTWSKDNSVELAAGWIVTGATPQALGAKITSKDFFGNVVGMNANGLAATVTAWNAACAGGADTAFGRAVSTLKPLSNPPYYAMELIECQTNTDGGPVHDIYARTLDFNNTPIPRLYSPGELGSLWGGLYYGAGNVCESVTMGRVAGAQAATLPSWS